MWLVICFIKDKTLSSQLSFLLIQIESFYFSANEKTLNPVLFGHFLSYLTLK